jgi:electron transfer flavoprotein alpha subunit
MGEGTMRIVVCIKQVPEVTEIRFDPEKRTIVRDGVKNIVNPFDRRAVTQAVEFKRRRGGEVVVLTMGPPQAREALRECLAMGADWGIHVCDPVLAGSDTLVTAKVLVRALERLVPGVDLIFCGKHSVDAETGQVGPELAELLGWPNVCGLTSVEELREDALRGYREVDDGLELVECSLPAVVTAAERLIRPTKVGERDLEAVGDAVIRTVTATELGLDPRDVGFSGSPTQVREIRWLERSRHVRFLENGDLERAAREVVRIIKQAHQSSEKEQGPVAPRPVQRSGPEIWVTVEKRRGRLREASLELLGEAARLAERMRGQACAIMFGEVDASEVEELGERGADRVYLLRHERMQGYSAEVWSHVLAEAIRKRQPEAVVCPSTAEGREYAPRTAARLGLGLTGDCIGLEVSEGGEILQWKPAFGGGIIASIVTRTRPVMATVRPGIFPLPERVPGRRAHVEEVSLGEIPTPRVRVLERKEDAGEAGIALERARIVIGVGAGIGTPEALPLIEELAQRMGAAVGASRKAVDLGWFPRQQQIGLTGKAIGPDVYLAIAVRGNLNHTVGIRRAKVVIAINTDPNAEIFQAADYGLVADYRAVLPVLIRAWEEDRS